MNTGKPEITVLHLDHTTAKGGAEYALLRMLEVQRSWKALVLLPRNTSGLGVYGSPSAVGNASIRQAGPTQTHGANQAGIGKLVLMGMKAIGVSVAVRFSREFRTCDVVHANTSRAAVYGAVACFMTKKPFVVHLRDTVNVESLGHSGFWLFTRVALRRATGVVANSQYTLDTARPYLNASAVSTVIPSASGLTPKGGSPTPVAPIVSRVGMVARIDPWKGQNLLIQAFSRVFKGTQVRLVLAGEPAFGHEEYLDLLKDQASSLGVADQIDFLGHVSEVELLIRSIDVCVQASTRAEPLGQNVLQYLAAGSVVVATSSGGPGEWVVDGKNGLLFEMNDIDSLTAVLSRAANDRQLRSRLSLNAATTPGLQSDSEIADAHAEFFRTCIEAGQGEKRVSNEHL